MVMPASGLRARDGATVEAAVSHAAEMPVVAMLESGCEGDGFGAVGVGAASAGAVRPSTTAPTVASIAVRRVAHILMVTD